MSDLDAQKKDWRARYCELARSYAAYAEKAERFIDWCMNELAEVYGAEHFADLFVQEAEQKASLRQSSTATGLGGDSQALPPASDSYESMSSLDSVTDRRKPTFKLDLSAVGQSSWLSGNATHGDFYADIKREQSTDSSSDA